MQDRELYEEILRLAVPWFVSEVQVDHAAQEIHVHVDHPRGTKFSCPECQAVLPCHDHAKERCWRHLDSCQFKTVLVARPPRVNCPEHGVKTVNVPWAEKHGRYTILFERFAIDMLLATQTVKGAMSILRIKWDQAWSIVERAVQRGNPSSLERLSSGFLPGVGARCGRPK